MKAVVWHGKRLGAEVIDYSAEDPVQTLLDLTGGIGPDRVIDAVGVDAERPKSGPAAGQAEQQGEQLDAVRDQVAPERDVRRTPNGELWRPGDAPLQVAQSAVQPVAKAGTIGVIGAVDPATVLTQVDTVTDAVTAYENVDRREEGCIKTALLTDAS